MARPQRWDEPFGPDMTDEDVARLMQRPEIAAVEAEKFPNHTPLEGILKNDTRIIRLEPGDIVVREGDYGNSAFLILTGKLRVVLAPGLPGNMLGRQPVQRKGFFEALSQLWRNRKYAEARPTNRHGRYTGGLRRGESPASTRVFLQDIPAILDEYRTATLGDGALFGELAALGRVPRTATIFAEGPAELLEIRWQGLRELRRYDQGWRRLIDERYRRNALTVHLTENPLFADLDEENLRRVAERTLFETYGSFDWHISYKQMRRRGESDIRNEPWIVREGDYPDGLLMIRAGFARVSVGTGRGHRTLTYLGAGDHFGLPELYALWKGEENVALRASLTALGYVDVLRVPGPVLETYVFPKLGAIADPIKAGLESSIAESAVVEWATDERFINGRRAMLIDLDRCVRCDDCVRACASTHDNNPRFVRQGKTFDHWMVANACMHCADPVCMIGCPTGAIHRTAQGGMVVINDVTCIGCATCANSCPYGNIRMVEICDEDGNFLLDPEKQMPILKATKCDLCSTQPGGPACVRACPHDALRRVDFQPQDLFEETPL